MNEPKYPIYSVDAVWDQDDHESNRTGFSVMFTEEKTQEEIDAYAQAWWDEYVVKQSRFSHTRPIDKNPRNIRLTAKYVEHETWCISWFAHYTFSTHLSDEELRRSFYHYVDRKRMEAEKDGDYDGGRLMGATDTWRWSAPCRCDGCTNRGVVTITH